MSRWKVRHALVQYTTKIADGNLDTITALRGEVVDIPEGHELERLKLHNAVVDPSTDLERPGAIMPLPQTASDEEMLQWIANATVDEVRQLAAERPDIAPRLTAAYSTVMDRRRTEDDLLGRVHSNINEAVDAAGDAEVPEFDEFGRPLVADDGMSAGVQQGVGGSAGMPHDAVPAPGEPGAPDPEAQAADGTPVVSADKPGAEVVKGTVGYVTEYISTHTHQAAEILEAENAQAAAGANGGQPRMGVVRAVEAAAGHTQ